ncbi:MAG TPA: hypothetical protein DCX06_14330 [Opitutae bacterium]|nr:hypothetical protein [Opitutae bacterium]
MKRNNDSLGNLLIMAPWWVSVVLGALSFIGLKYVAPSLGSENAITQPFAQALPQLSPYAALFFGMLALISFFFGRKQAALVDKQESLDSLCNVTWKEFEWLVGEAFRRQGYAIEESLGGGADGGIDLILRRDSQTTLVQCKRWKSKPVGVPIIREIFGILTAEGADRAAIITTSRFTKESEEFAAGKPIDLIDGPQLLRLIQSVQSKPAPPAPSIHSTERPVTATPISPSKPAPEPTCPQCNNSMVQRTARRGANAGKSFWGCSNYPKCRGVVAIDT